MIEYLLMKHDIDLKHELSEYLITASRSNDTGILYHEIFYNGKALHVYMWNTIASIESWYS